MEVYVALTDRHTWGKGIDPIVALYHSMQSYDDQKQAQIYKITFPENYELPNDEVMKSPYQAIDLVGVDGMGAISYPKGCEVVDLGVMNITGIPAKFRTIKNKVRTFCENPKDAVSGSGKAMSKLVNKRCPGCNAGPGEHHLKDCPATL